MNLPMLSKTNENGLFCRIISQIFIKQTISFIRIIDVQLNKSIHVCLTSWVLPEITQFICVLKLHVFFLMTSFMALLVQDTEAKDQGK